MASLVASLATIRAAQLLNEPICDAAVCMMNATYATLQALVSAKRGSSVASHEAAHLLEEHLAPPLPPSLRGLGRLLLVLAPAACGSLAHRLLDVVPRPRRTLRGRTLRVRRIDRRALLAVGEHLERSHQLAEPLWRVRLLAHVRVERAGLCTVGNPDFRWRSTRRYTEDTIWVDITIVVEAAHAWRATDTAIGVWNCTCPWQAGTATRVSS
eukprot:6183846-Pleurochrysis_carterae.AAC.2